MRSDTGEEILMHEQLMLDILLNPSVREEDENRLSAQAEAILILFRSRRQTGLEVSTLDMKEIALQYNARLYEVRRYLIAKGECIDLVRRGPGGINYYKIVPLEKSEFYKERNSND